MVEDYVVKKTTMPQYGECEYWDERYSREPAAFDWYQGFNGLQSILHQAFPQNSTILHVGVGSSRLQEDMAREGWRSIINVDYSRVVINHMAELHKGVRSLAYQVADVRSMPEFTDCSFEGVLDKGTLDAILCGEQSSQHAAAMLAECFRVLKPGYAFMLVTYGDPSSRLPYLEEISSWDIVVYALTKQEVLEAMDSEPLVRPLIKGPYPAKNMDCMDALSGLEGMHFVYLCYKLQEDPHPEEEEELQPPEAAEGHEPLQGWEKEQQQQSEPHNHHYKHHHPVEQSKTTASSVSSPVRSPAKPASSLYDARTDDLDTGISTAAPERPAAVPPAS